MDGAVEAENARTGGGGYCQNWLNSPLKKRGFQFQRRSRWCWTGSAGCWRIILGCSGLRVSSARWRIFSFFILEYGMYVRNGMPARILSFPSTTFTRHPSPQKQVGQRNESWRTFATRNIPSVSSVSVTKLTLFAFPLSAISPYSVSFVSNSDSIVPADFEGRSVSRLLRLIIWIQVQMSCVLLRT